MTPLALILVALGAFLVYCSMKDRNPIQLVLEVLQGKPTSK